MEVAFLYRLKTFEIPEGCKPLVLVPATLKGSSSGHSVLYKDLILQTSLEEIKMDNNSQPVCEYFLRDHCLSLSRKIKFKCQKMHDVPVYVHVKYPNHTVIKCICSELFYSGMANI